MFKKVKCIAIKLTMLADLKGLEHRTAGTTGIRPWVPVVDATPSSDVTDGVCDARTVDNGGP